MTFDASAPLREALEDRRAPLWIPVTRELIARIVRGDYPPESAIPTEAELGDEFRVSRTVVRESVKMLLDKTLVRIERGRGTIVQPAKRWRTFDPAVLAARLEYADREVVMRELLLLRKAIEPELAAIAAAGASDVAIARLGARVEALGAAQGDRDAYCEADQAFHAALSEIADVSLAREIFEVMAPPIEMARKLTIALPGALEAAHAQHLEIFGAIRDRDPERARGAMRAHMDWNEQRLEQVL